MRLAVLTRCARTTPEDPNGESDQDQAKRVHQRGCEAAQGSFQGPDPRCKSVETYEEVGRFSETEGARIGHWLRSSAVGIAATLKLFSPRGGSNEIATTWVEEPAV